MIIISIDDEQLELEGDAIAIHDLDNEITLQLYLNEENEQLELEIKNLKKKAKQAIFIRPSNSTAKLIYK